jgi:hypothetical protein
VAVWGFVEGAVSIYSRGNEVFFMNLFKEGEAVELLEQFRLLKKAFGSDVIIIKVVIAKSGGIGIVSVMNHNHMSLVDADDGSSDFASEDFNDVSEKVSLNESKEFYFG